MMQRGVVEQVNGAELFVRIPAYGDAIFGPLELMRPVGTPAPVVPVGTRVILGQIGKIKEDMVVLGTVDS